MLNKNSVRAVDSARFSTHFAKPLYDGYSFARIPETTLKLLGGQGKNPLPKDVLSGKFEKYDVVLLFLIDGFGWEFYQKYVDKYPFLERFLNEGVVSKISSQFPSTTAAHITTINTGLEVGQSGIYEWFYYEPLVDSMISPLPFSFAGDHDTGTLFTSDVSADLFFPETTLYESLSSMGCDSYILQHESIAYSPYSRAMCKGGNIVPFKALSEGLEKAVNLSQKPSTDPAYIFLYFGDIDSVGHRSGISSEAFANSVESCWKVMEEHFWKKMDALGKKIACIVTADHGMVPIDPKTTIYLNEVFPNITSDFVQNRMGKPLVPAGSSRDFFLHVRRDRLDKVMQELKVRFKGIAEVYLTEELMNLGFFGATAPSQQFLSRVGNVVILPYINESIWWQEKGRFTQNFYASHGGLTPEEMHSLFLFIDI